jgi:TGS domain/Leucine Rich repeats (2 copies)
MVHFVPFTPFGDGHCERHGCYGELERHEWISPYRLGKLHHLAGSFPTVAGAPFSKFSPQCRCSYSQSPAMDRKPLTEQSLAAFAALLSGHLDGGTRPGSGEGEPWTNTEFAEAVVGRTRANRRRQDTTGVADTTVSAWRSGKSLPGEIEPILRALFGPTKPEGGEKREALRNAFGVARAWRAKRSLEAAQDPSGVTYVPRGSQFAIKRTPAKDDFAAAADQNVHAEHLEVVEAARGLVSLTERRRNQLSSPGWDDLLPTARRFLTSIDCRTESLPERLMTAYYACVSLGSLLDQDETYRKHPEDGEAPLSADLRRKLGDLVTFAAQLLHAFPYVATRDRRLQRFLNLDDIASAQLVTTFARDREVLWDPDQAVIDDILAASHRNGAQGDKAKEHLFVAISNLLLASASAKLDGARTHERLDLNKRLDEFFAVATEAIEPIVRMLSPEVRSAFRHVNRIVCFTPKGDEVELPRGATSVDFAYAVHSEVGDACVGAKVNGRLMPLRHQLQDGDQVEIMTARGATPSPLWERFVVTDHARMHIRRFVREGLEKPSRDDGKSELTKTFRQAGVVEKTDQKDQPAMNAAEPPSDFNLQAAHVILLSGEAPKSSWLPWIRVLSFVDAKLKDLSPLANLTALQNLDLRGTEVSDLSPLANLTALQTLDLRGTEVSDLSPLANLISLQNLDLRDTQVRELSPLAGLIALQSLHLRDSQISDVSSLASLIALQSLDLRHTPISDLSPLASLTALRNLYLRDTPVSDVSPLAGLTALQNLYLQDTKVSDLSPLASLTALQTLDLQGTPVSDVSSLAGLTALRILHLQDTRESDMSLTDHISPSSTGETHKS